MAPDPGRSLFPEVAVVVLNWNGASLTERCLASLEQLDYPNHHVTVVDNGSDDGSADRISTAWPGVLVLRTGTNRGFAGGSNVGIRHAMEGGARFVWLLNNDTIVAPDALTAMMREMEDPEVGIVGSVIRSTTPPHMVEVWGGGTVNRYLATTKRFTGPGQGTLDHVVGTSMLARREVFETIGLLDETFFFYLEETDLCLRATARGWRLSVAGGATVLHEGGATVNAGHRGRSEHGDHLHARSSGIFIARYAGPWAVPAAALRLFGITVRRGARGQWRRIPGLWREFVRGLKAGARREPIHPPPRPAPLPR
jgi:GT2 family glycosyltransferase